MIITAHNLTYAYPDSPVAALDGLTATFAEGWTGIVGANGAGKSTLIALLCGLEKPDEGSIQPSVAGVYCAQSTDLPPANLEDFAVDYSSSAIRLRASLKLEDEWLWRYDTLSHGERKRIQVACALSLEPAVLALDEPTNHLDAATRDVLLATLASYRGVGLLVSHDRRFLDELVYQCLFLEAGKGTMIPGTYTDAKSQMDLRMKTAATERKHAREELARMQGESSRRQAEAGKTASRRSGRHLDKHDNDGRAKLRLAIVSGQDGKAGQLSSQMDKRVEAAQKRLDGAKVKKVYDKPLDIDTAPAKRKVVAHMPKGRIPMGETRGLNHPELFVGPTDRIGFRGRNGAGKSTLLSALLARIGDAAGVLSIPQEVDGETARATLAAIKALPASERGRVFSIVARLNSPPERLLSGDDLSPGELRKMMLAVGLLGRPFLVAMDEPTNHLDIASIEALQDVLGQVECTLLLVSHDEAFLDELTDIRWDFVEREIEDGTRGDSDLVVSWA